MRALVVLAAIAAVAVGVAASSHEFDLESGSAYTFDLYCKQFGKHYPERHVYAAHKATFERNLRTVMEHNSNANRGAHSWRRSVNKFTDLSETERKCFLGTGVTNIAARLGGERIEAGDLQAPEGGLPSAVDWRTVQPSIITPPKDQGQCGSCWAHGATESVESYTAMATGQLLSLSRQNLVDCVPNPDQCGGVGGCGGATAELAFAWVASNGGMATEAAYPYQAVNGVCKTTAMKAATVQSWTVLPNNNYTALVTAIATVGPLAINADASAWFDYSSGVFTGCDFTNIDINHVIQMVGYGTDPTGGDYWLVRNSWSASWGEGGYIRIQKHSDGTSQWCGPDTKPSDGVGCNGGPSQVTVCGSCGIWYDTSFPTGANVVGVDA